MQSGNQYQHYIPHFILRAFQKPVTPVPVSPTSTNKKRARRALQKERTSTETIHCYYLATGEYNPSSVIDKSCGFTDQYHDATKLEKLSRIEDQFTKLENDAAKVIKLIQQAVDSRKVNIDLLRKDLYRFRMFLFLLQIRSKNASDTHFQEDHPGNARIRNWIQQHKGLHDLLSNKHLWLNGLEYYLNTGVAQILEDAQPKDQKTYSEVISKGTKPGHGMGTDIDFKHWHAQTYEAFHNLYYLSICKADPDSEFILGHNSFGIWEGTLGERDGQVHRLYVISPQIAIILRLDPAKVPLFNTMMVRSILNDIPFSPPITHHLNDPSKSTGTAFQPSNYSPSDNFTFKTTQLTGSQTYRINEIILENVRADGKLTFASEDKMLSTLLLYDTPHGSFARPHRDSLRRLRYAISVRFSSHLPPNIQTNSGTPLGPTPPLPPAFVSGVSAGVSSPTCEAKRSHTGQSSGNPLVASDTMDKNPGDRGRPTNATDKGGTLDGLGRANFVVRGADDITSIASTTTPAFGPGAWNAHKEGGQQNLEELLCEMDQVGPSPTAFRTGVESASGADVEKTIRPEPSPQSPTQPLTGTGVPYQWPNDYPPIDATVPNRLDTGLPVTRDDYMFDRVFKEALTTWDQAGRSRNFALLRMVYLHARTANEVNHPVALKIRYMICDTVRQRITTQGDKVLFPWVMPKQKLEDFLNDAEFQIIFSAALDLAKEDGLFGPNYNQNDHFPPTSMFVQDVAVYGYLTEWLHRQEIFRLAMRVRTLGTPGLHWKFYTAHAGPSPFLLFGVCSIIQDVYCVWRFAGLNRYKLHALMLSFVDTRAWYQKPLEMAAVFLFQLAEFSFIEGLVGHLTHLIFYSSFFLYAIVVALGMIGMIFHRATPRV